MTGCIVWRCTRPNVGRGLCALHDAVTPEVPTGPTRADRAEWADLLDPERMADEVRAHNATLATNVLLDALR